MKIPFVIEHNIMAKEFSAITHKYLIELSLKYAGQYEINPRNFIGCFLKYHSVKEACAWIVRAYKHSGAFQECKGDFSEYANKQKIDDKWKRVLAEILLIIYSIIHV